MVRGLSNSGLRFQVFALLLSLAWLWFQLINHLRIEWSLNEQYNYGWAVPFLCVYLLWDRAGKTKGAGWQAPSAKRFALPASRSGNSGLKFQVSGLRFGVRRLFFRILFPGLCFFYLPTRLVQEANPEWRLGSWALALEVVGITLILGDWAFCANAERLEGGNQTPRKCARGREKAAKRNRERHETCERGKGLWSMVNCQASAVRDLSVFAFPVLFFLVAVPWPTVIEGSLIQGLTRATTAVTVDLLGLVGTPVVQQGNVIEVATGVVGVDEACSGIRSFQATLMLALFFGHLYGLPPWRRVLLVGMGFALALAFNVGRTALLTYVASVKGVSAIKSWHDPAGVAILVGCFLSLWGVARLLAKDKRLSTIDHRLRNTDFGPLTIDQSAGTADQVLNLNPTPALNPQDSGMINSEIHKMRERGQGAERNAQGAGHAELHVSETQVSGLRSQVYGLSSNLYGQRSKLPGLFLLLWLFLVEIGVEGWYRWHEGRLPEPVAWSVQLPESNPGFRRVAVPERTRRILRYDEAANAAWTGPSNSRWQVIFLRWNPGRTAVHLAKNHTPEVCFGSAGRRVVSQSEVRWYESAGLKLPFRVYEVADPAASLRVFYCLWDDRASAQGAETMMLTYSNRLAPVLAGRRQSGQRSLEVAVWGYEQPGEAEEAFKAELVKLVVVD